jgi:hypothetical protein
MAVLRSGFFRERSTHAGFCVIAGSVSDVLTLLLCHYNLYEMIFALHQYRTVPGLPMIRHYTALHAVCPDQGRGFPGL